MVLLLWWRRRYAGALIGAVFAITTAGLFGITALTSGEFNYQGGDRKTFYGYFPFDAPDASWERRGIAMSTNDADTERARSLGGRRPVRSQRESSDRSPLRPRAVLFRGRRRLSLARVARAWTSWRVLTMLG